MSWFVIIVTKGVSFEDPCLFLLISLVSFSSLCSTSWLCFQRTQEQWNPASQKETFVFKSGTESNVAIGREMEGDYSAISIALLKFSPGITGQTGHCTALFGRGNSPVNCLYESFPGIPSLLRRLVPNGLENSFVYRNPGRGIRRYLHFFWFPWSQRHQLWTQMSPCWRWTFVLTWNALDSPIDSHVPLLMGPSAQEASSTTVHLV